MFKKFIVIETKYVGPTNSNGSKINASLSDKSARKSMSYDHALSGEINHALAAQCLMNKIDPQCVYHRVGYADAKNGHTFIFEARY